MDMLTNGNVLFNPPTSLEFGASLRQMLNLYGPGFGIGIQNNALYQRSAGEFVWYNGGVHNDAFLNAGGGQMLLRLNTAGMFVTGKVGIGSTTPVSQLEVVGQDALGLVGGQPYLTLKDDLTGYAMSRIQGAGGDVMLETDAYIHTTDPATGFVIVKSGSGNVGIGTGFPQAKLDVIGTIRTKVLTITGGADVAEPFLLKEEHSEPGSVVVIDDEHAGRLKLSGSAYDNRVAGIVSGANGINPGISLQQEGSLEGGQKVALSGRVYVQADAAYGAIKPGDMLTTSNTPGHAMKVTDHARAQGAILGKAMSPLQAGQGLVLVLVTLQ